MSLPIVVEPVERSRALHAIRPLAVRYGLSAYDAAYLELAVWRSLPLATLDGALAEAAREAGAGVL